MHCDHMLEFSADLSLWFDSLMFWAPKHVHLLPDLLNGTSESVLHYVMYSVLSHH